MNQQEGNVKSACSAEKLVDGEGGGKVLGNDCLSAFVDLGSPVLSIDRIGTDFKHVIWNVEYPIFRDGAFGVQRHFDSCVVPNARVGYLDEQQNVPGVWFERSEELRQRLAYHHVW